MCADSLFCIPKDDAKCQVCSLSPACRFESGFYVLIMKSGSCSVMSDSASPWTVQAPLSREFFKQECWSRQPFPSPGGLPDPGIIYTQVSRTVCSQSSAKDYSLPLSGVCTGSWLQAWEVCRLHAWSAVGACGLAGEIRILGVPSGLQVGLQMESVDSKYDLHPFNALLVLCQSSFPILFLTFSHVAHDSILQVEQERNEHHWQQPTQLGKPCAYFFPLG